jgi:hypothetical protein
MLNSELLYNAVGTAGAALILFGFYRTSIGRWTNKSLWYELDNLIGPMLLIVYQLHHHTYISVIINVVWAVVAFRGLRPFVSRYRMRHQRRPQRATQAARN